MTALVAVYRPYPARESQGVEAGGKAEQEGGGGEKESERGRLPRYSALTGLKEGKGGKKRKGRKRKKKDTFLERERNAKGVRG